MYRESGLLARVYQRRQRLALKWVDGLGLRQSAQVLEIGCGAGYAAVALAQRGFTVAATDTVPRMLALALGRAQDRGVAHKLRVTYGDAHGLGFGDGTFELVVALGVIPWLHSPTLALHEIARVLQPRGRLIVSADNRLRLTHLLDPRLNPAFAAARRTARHVVRAAPREAYRPPRMHSPFELDVLLASVGLEKVAGVTCGFGPFTFVGRQLLFEGAAASLDRGLQRLADAGLTGLRCAGSQYLVLAQKR